MTVALMDFSGRVSAGRVTSQGPLRLHGPIPAFATQHTNIPLPNQVAPLSRETKWARRVTSICRARFSSSASCILLVELDHTHVTSGLGSMLLPRRIHLVCSKIFHIRPMK